MSTAARDEIGGKPEAVQIVLKAQILKAVLEETAPNHEAFAQQALAWWAGLRAECPEVADEEVLAAMILERLRKQDVWGKLLDLTTTGK